jgi:hypothetical protein
MTQGLNCAVAAKLLKRERKLSISKVVQKSLLRKTTLGQEENTTIMWALGTVRLVDQGPKELAWSICVKSVGISS